MKDGWKTTEFWTSIFAQLAGLAVIAGVVEPDTADAVSSAASMIAGGVITGAGAIGYAYARGKAKNVK